MTDLRDATLEELLSDPMILKYMARDGYHGDDIRRLLQQARLRDRTRLQGSFLASRAVACNHPVSTASGAVGTC